MTWERDRLRIRQYWSLAEVAARPPAAESREEAVAAIRERLLEAVSQRLIGDVPLGVFLSGGIDSSSIVALCREVRAQPPDTFSVVFSERKFSEAGYSSRVAKLFRCRHHEIRLAEREFREEIPRALGAMDQPSVDGVNTYVVCHAAKRAGITVALSGIGGDEAFAGYSTSRWVPRMLAFKRHARWLKPLGKGTGARLGRSPTNRLTKAVALCTGQFYGGHPYFLVRGLFLPPSVRRLLRIDSSDDTGMSPFCGSRAVAERVRVLDPVNQVCVLEGATYLANMLLRDTDGMSMAHGLEVRGPLLDHRLWEYVLPLGQHWKLDSHVPKPLLLAAGAKLPKEIYLRRKMGFTLPFDRWLREGLAPLVRRELADSLAPELFPVDPVETGRVWRAFLGGRTSWSRPWALYAVKLWIRRNIGAGIEACH